MKTVTYNVVIRPADPDETGYWAEIPALPGCFTQGETYDEVIERAREAIRCHLKGLFKDGEPIPPSDANGTDIVATAHVVVGAAELGEAA